MRDSKNVLLRITAFISMLILNSCYDTNVKLNKNGDKAGVSPSDETTSDGLNTDVAPLDTDEDGIPDQMEVEMGTDPSSADSDGDGKNDLDDPFPLDPKEDEDTDGDGIGNNSDEDDDNDGLSDLEEGVLGTDPILADTDGDGYHDSEDELPLDPNEWLDLDGDGTGANSDGDKDGDGVVNESDVFPENGLEWADSDGDLIGNNEDVDDDNDGLIDTQESTLGTDPLTPDSDGDGVIDSLDAFPLDPSEWVDSDGDGMGNVSDLDDDNDGLSDVDEELIGSDPLNADTDGDGFLDGSDNFVLDSSEWLDTDSDGLGNNVDSDDDNDGLSDNVEQVNGSDPLIVDTDNDGITDANDGFPTDNSKALPELSISSPSPLAVNAATNIIFNLSYAGASAINLTDTDVTVIGTGTAACASPVNLVGSSTDSPVVTLSNCTGDGSISISVASGKATFGASGDLGGTSSAATVDNTAPLLTISNPSQTIAPSSVEVFYTLTYEEPPTGLSLSDISINGTDADCVLTLVDETTQTPVVGISACSVPGNIGITVASSKSQDQVGNPDGGAVSATFELNNTVAVVNIASPSPVAGSSATTFEYGISYTNDDGVYDLQASDVTLTTTGSVNCTSPVTIVSGNTASPTVQVVGCSGNGTVAITVAADVVQSTTLLGNSQTTSGDATVDNVAPSVTISAPSSALMKSSDTVTFMLTYEEIPSSLVSGDISVNGNSTDCSISIVDAATTSPVVEVSGCSDNGSITISVAAGESVDAAGNLDAGAGPSASVNLDNTAPTVTIGAPDQTSIKSADTVTFTLTYEEIPASLVAGDITVTGNNTDCSVAIVDPASTTPDVQVSGCSDNGSITISVAAGESVDAAGNLDAGAGPSASVTVDNTAPTVSIGAPSLTDINSADTVTFVLTYEVSPTALVAGDITVAGTNTDCAVAVRDASTTTPEVDVSGCSGDGSITISVAAGESQDTDGNLDVGAGPSASVSVDNTVPTVTIGPPDLTDINSSDTVTFTLTYEEIPSALLAGDITVNGNNTDCAVAILDSATTTPDVQVSGCSDDGSITITVAAGESQDAAGNLDLGAGPSNLVSVDNTLPTVSIGSPTLTTISSDDTTTYTLNYEIAPVGLTSSDITVNGNALNCSVNLRDETTTSPMVDITGCSVTSGSISISLAGGKSQDLAGNTDTGDAASDSVTIANALTYTPSAEDFVSVWRTVGTSETVTIPTKPLPGFNYFIDWGDGTIEELTTTSPSHVYASAGDYTVRIQGAFPSIHLNGDAVMGPKLVQVTNLGNVLWRDLSHAFNGATNLESFVSGETDTSIVTSMTAMFKNTPSLTSADLHALDTRSTVDMARMFENSTGLTHLSFLSFDSSKVTDFSYMFAGANSVQALEISVLNTSNATNLSSMFSGMSSVTALDLSSFTTSNVANVNRMFSDSTAIEAVNLNNWDITNVTSSINVFENTPALGSTPGKIVYCDQGGGTIFGENCIDITETAPAADILISMDGADGSTAFTDSSANGYTVNTNGQSQIEASEGRFGQALFLDGSGDYLSMAHNANLTFEGEFTVDIWVKQTSAQSYPAPMVIGEYTNGILYRINSDSWVNNSNFGSVSSYISMNTWHHLAVTRDSSDTVRFFVDGNERLSSVVSGTINSANGALNLGGYSAFSQYMTGFLDEFRVIKGSAEWTANFTPPSQPYADLVVSTDTDSDGIPDSRDLDKDDDGLDDGIEALIGTSPLLADTDSDGISDRDEYLQGLDPLVYTNVSPVLGVISHEQVVTNQVKSGIALTVSDPNGGLVCSTALSPSSSDISVIQNTGVVFSGTWPNCEMELTPVINASGFSEITVSLTDGSFTVDQSFYYLVSVTPPNVVIGAPSPSAISSSMSTVYELTYEFAPNALDAADIIVGGNSYGCTVAIADESSTTPDVTVSGCLENGSITISLSAGTSQNGSGVPDLGAGPSGSVTLDNIPASITIGPPSISTVDSVTPVTFEITFEAMPSGFGENDVIIIGNSSGCAVSVADGATLTPDVTITGCTQNGWIAINIAGGSSTDALGNVDIGAGPSDSVILSNFPEGWFQQAYIKASNASGSDRFGHSVSIDGDTLAVSAYEEDENLTVILNGTTAPNNDGLNRSGAVYVYERTGSTWQQQAYIKASNAGSNDYFSVVSLSKDTLAVGAPNEDSSSRTIINGTTSPTNNSRGDSGAVYIYQRTANSWSQEAYIKSVVADGGDHFGQYLSLSGDTLAVGVDKEDELSTDIVNGTNIPNLNERSYTGAAHVFRRTGTNWAHEAYIKPSSPQSDWEYFGSSVSISGNTLAVGSYAEDSNQSTITNGTTSSSNNSITESGAVYIFSRSGSIWSQEAYIKAYNVDSYDYFGEKLSLSEDLLAVSATRDDASETTIINGTTSYTTNGNRHFGSVTIYKRTSGTWQQEAYIKAAAAGYDDYFGTSVALSSHTLAVGVPNEDSSGSTILNGTTGDWDNSKTESGAVYVFKRVSGNWEQESFIKPGNTDTGDQFGYSLSISGDTIAVGAPYEDALQTTVTNGGGVSNDNSLADSGAVYIYNHTLRMFEVQNVNYQSISANQIDISWSGQNIGTGISVKVVYQSGVAAPADCTLGTEVYSGTNESASLSSLTADTQYSFRICTYDGSSYSEGITFSTSTPESIGPNVTSILRLDASPTTENTVRYALSFDEPVKGLNLSNLNPMPLSTFLHENSIRKVDG